MAASDKHDEHKPQPGPADALREAVERTFRDAAGNMAGAGSRAQGLFDEAAAALARLGGTGEATQPVVDAIEALSARVDALASRLEALEQAPAPAVAEPPKRRAAAKAKPAPKSRAKKKPAASA